MIAEGDDGPYIPAMACEAIIRRCLDGMPPALGARAAVNDVELSDYEVLFLRRAIYAGSREAMPDTVPLYRRLLGRAYDAMPEPLRAMHDLKDTMSAEGVATVTRGTSLLARIAGMIVGFPKAGENAGARRFQERERRRALDEDFRGRARSIPRRNRGAALRVADVRALWAAVRRHGARA